MYILYTEMKYTVVNKLHVENLGNTVVHCTKYKSSGETMNIINRHVHIRNPYELMNYELYAT